MLQRMSMDDCASGIPRRRNFPGRRVYPLPSPGTTIPPSLIPGKEDSCNAGVIVGKKVLSRFL
jgi:hypothetical protein